MFCGPAAEQEGDANFHPREDRVERRGDPAFRRGGRCFSSDRRGVWGAAKQPSAEWFQTRPWAALVHEGAGHRGPGPPFENNERTSGAGPSD